MPPDSDINRAPACLCRGTLIDTYHGAMPVEELLVDDLVMTKDDGFQPLRWIGTIRVQAKGRMAPVRIASGAIGNTRSLVVSQQHRLLISDWRAEFLFGEREVLVPAKSLVNDSDIWVQAGGAVDYFHLIFDRHQIIYAEDSPSESFLPGPEGLEGIEAAARDEILDLFPQLAANPDRYGPPARLILKPYEVKALQDYRG